MLVFYKTDKQLPTSVNC